MRQCQHQLNGQQNIKICLNKNKCDQNGIFCEQCTNIHEECKKCIYSLEEFKNLIEDYRKLYELKNEQLNLFHNKLRDLFDTLREELGNFQNQLQQYNDYIAPLILLYDSTFQYYFLQPYDLNKIEHMFKYYTILEEFIQGTQNHGEQTQLKLEQAFRKFKTQALQKKMKIINLANILDNENSIQDRQQRIEEEPEQNQNLIGQLDYKLHMIEQSDFTQLSLSQLSQKNEDEQQIKYISILSGEDIIVVRKNNIIFFNQETLEQIAVINTLTADQEYTGFINKNEESSFYVIVDQIQMQGWRRQREIKKWENYVQSDFKNFKMQTVSYDSSSKKIITEIRKRRKYKFKKELASDLKLRKSSTCLFVHDENLIFIGGLKSVHAIINKKKKVSFKNIKENVTAIYYHKQHVIVGTKMRILLFKYQQLFKTIQFMNVYDFEVNVLFIAPFLDKILINVIFEKSMKDQVKHSIYQNYLLDIENTNELSIQQENTYNINNQIKLIQKNEDTTLIFQVFENPLKILND